MNNPLAGTWPAARLEFAQALVSVRSLVFVGLFTLLVAAPGFFGLTLFFNNAQPAEGLAAGTGFLIVAMVFMVLFVGPLLAIFTTTDNVVAERQARTLDGLLTRPVTRRGLALGKFAGRGAHLVLTAVLGVGLGSIAFGTKVPLDASRILYFLACVALLLLIYCAIGLLISSVSKTTGTAFAAGAMVWLAPILFFGFISNALRPMGLEGIVPWLNPNTLFLGAVGAVFTEPGNLAGLAAGITPSDALAAMVLYVIVMAALAVEVFHRQDETGG